MRALLVAFVLMAVAFAGCTDQGEETPNVPGETELQAGKGAIAGLLVDDRFRPIQLTDNPESEFQAAGFVLVQETGDKVQTTENGEFLVSDLEPGSYTLRASVEGHEVTPLSVAVKAAEFAEASLVARRVASEGTTVVTQEYTVFVACSVAFLLPVTINECDLDLSGDSNRWSFEVDYTDYNASHLVVEMLANQDANRYEVDIWYVPDSLTDDALWYASKIFEGDYAKIVLAQGETSEVADYTSNDPWMNDFPFQTDFYIFGEGSEELGDPTDNYLIGGVGLHLGVKARFVHSLFLGEPDVDLETYCLLC